MAEERDDDRLSSEPARGRRPTSVARASRAYRPRRVTDYLFLHGLALSAARRAIREDRDRLYPPAEWMPDGFDDDPR